MEINKPKEFNFTKQEKEIIIALPTGGGIAIWGNVPAPRVSFRPQLFNNFNVRIGGQVWEVKCPDPKINMEQINVRDGHARSRITGEPLIVEFYSCDDSAGVYGTDLHRWIQEIEANENILNYNNLTKDLQFDAVGLRDHHFILYNAYLSEISINDAYQSRFDMDAMIECRISFERYEML